LVSLAGWERNLLGGEQKSFLNDKCWKLIVGILVGEGVERTTPYLSSPHVPPPRPPYRSVGYRDVRQDIWIFQNFHAW